MAGSESFEFESGYEDGSGERHGSGCISSGGFDSGVNVSNVEYEDMDGYLEYAETMNRGIVGTIKDFLTDHKDVVINFETYFVDVVGAINVVISMRVSGYLDEAYEYYSGESVSNPYMLSQILKSLYSRVVGG